VPRWTFHWLEAVKGGAGSTDADAVVAKMKEMKVNDFCNGNVEIRRDKKLMHRMYLWQVKSPEESKSPNHDCKHVGTMRGIP
jgi:branched-chain amino acid transport system substrate-binding protein